MKILIDIGHPAHVHYFRNFIKIMESKGHEFLIIAKNRNIVQSLLNQYQIPYILRNDYPKSLISKLLRIPLTDFFIIRQALKFKPAILIGFSGTHIAHAGFILRRPRIVIDDTEHAKFAHLSYKPFASVILTPYCFRKNFGKKHIRFKSYMELCYLHPNYFTPDNTVRYELGVKDEEKFIIVRFVSWRASHDIGETGLSTEYQRKLVLELSKYYKVFISSEETLPEDLKIYSFNLHPSKMHDALAACDLFIGEGVTMASESAILGTPAIYINSLELGYTTEQEIEYGLVYNYRKPEGIIEKALELLNKYTKDDFKAKKNELLSKNIDPTSLLLWFIEQYPNSKHQMKLDPNLHFD